MKIKMEEAEGVTKLKECGLSEADAATLIKNAAKRYEEETTRRKIKEIIAEVVEGVEEVIVEEEPIVKEEPIEEPEAIK